MSLIRNSALNMAGSVIPALVALPAIGYLARTLGAERFGLLTLAWALVGYATLFDLGLSRAVSQYVAKHLQSVDKSRTALGTAVGAVTASGSFVAVILYCSSALLTDHVFNVSVLHRQDAIVGIGLLGLTVPFLLSTLIIHGFFEGRELFVESNLQKTIAGTLIFLMPVLCVKYTATFSSAVVGLFVARLVSLFVAMFRCNTIEPLRNWRFSKETLRDLVNYGGGIAITNTISPIMGYLDRFFLSSIQGAQIVGYYSGAAELVSRLAVVPVSISRALFPKLVVATGNRSAVVALKNNARKYTAISCLPPAIIIFVFAEQLLTLWLGADMSQHASPLLRILIVGFAFNAFAQVPFSAIQARGDSYLTAKIQLFEVIPYVVMLFYLGRAYGGIGVAIAWTTRIAADLVIMEYYSRRVD